MSRVRVLVVDDSAFMRLALKKMISDAGDIDVVGEARDGRQAVQLAKALKPDVVTMDLEMPELDGVGATKAILAEVATKVIIVSSLTEPGTKASFDAFAAGAVDVVAKGSSDMSLDLAQIGQELVRCIRGCADKAPPSRRRASIRPTAVAPRRRVDMVVVGVSTGGPRTVVELLKSAGALPFPVVIAQHMPPLFTASFAQNLAAETGLNVREGRSGMSLDPGTWTIIPGGSDGVVGVGLNGAFVFSVRTDPNATIHPNADVLFESAARVCKSAVGVILTGMGSDGTHGAVRFREREFPVLVQEPSTCIVAGMPGAAIDAGAASQVLPVSDIGKRLAEWGRQGPAAEG
jgi:two-component system chemotaxis response regulator CheB